MNLNIDIRNLAIIISPNLVMTIMGQVCPMQKDKMKLAQQPPGYIFGIVWTILNLFTGYALKVALESNNRLLLISVILQMIFTNMWLYYYNCQEDKKSGLYIIALSLAATMAIKENSNDVFVRNSMILYTTWLFYAFAMNFEKVGIQ